MREGPVPVLAPDRPGLLRRGLRLEYLTVGWNLIEGLIAVAAAVAAGSVALLGFGIDSFVESASGSVLIWRFRAEWRAEDQEALERLERRASMVTYIASKKNVAPTKRSLAVMWWLAREKRRAAIAPLRWRRARSPRGTGPAAPRLPE